MAVAVISIALLFFLGHALKWLFIKTKIPDLLILVALGFFLGPVLGVIQGRPRRASPRPGMTTKSSSATAWS